VTNIPLYGRQFYSSTMVKSKLLPTCQLRSLPDSHTEKSQLLNLPPELMLVIIRLLSRRDHKTFCLLSRWSRQLALPILFRKLKYSGTVEYQIGNINQAKEDVKAAVRSVRTFLLTPYYRALQIVTYTPKILIQRALPDRNLHPRLPIH
jgi:hypothetical protein